MLLSRLEGEPVNECCSFSPVQTPPKILLVSKEIPYNYVHNCKHITIAKSKTFGN